MVKLNQPQLGLLAEAVKDLGFAAFGVFGLPAIDKVLKNAPLGTPDFAMLAMGATLFLLLLGVSLAVVRSEGDEQKEST